MSGASLPYHLRPHKAVDRRIFVDLLGRLERWQDMSDYVYVSMGAYPLEDHKLIHRILGVRRLIAFDNDGAVVKRQRFNKPINTCHCIEKMSGEVVDTFDDILTDCGFGNPAGVIVWLDYTDPKQIGSQLREFQALLDRLSAGDVIRVTVNSHPRELINHQDSRLTVEDKRTRQFNALQSWIKEYLPSWATADHMTAEDLPRVIAGSFAAASLKALPVSSSLTFRPLSLVRYTDSTQMLSITGIIANRSDERSMLTRLAMNAWPFASDTWSDIHKLVVPDLTIRERLFLEREIVSKTPAQIIKALGFESTSGVAISEFIDTYKNYYRFYPTLLVADL